MVDNEVENILREIRERVLAEQEQLAIVKIRLGSDDSDNNSPLEADGVANELDYLDSYLTTTARAWDKLPPLMSNRTGAIARFELWVKGCIKRSTRWFTWEQVNFNAAVHQALRSTLKAFSSYEKRFDRSNAELRAETEARQQEFARTQAEFDEVLRETKKQLEQFLTQHLESRTNLSDLRAEIDARLSELTQELRERDEHSTAEQRVCYKQLTLQVSEATVLQDRARRNIESRLERLEKELDKSTEA